MPEWTKLERGALASLREELQAKYDGFKSRGLRLDMSRGKPSPAQLDLANDLLICLGTDDFTAADGTDCRNYGGLDGIPEAKQLFADYLEVKPAEIVIGGNSSLAMMHDTIARAMSHGAPGGAAPWGRLPAVKFLCPSPGYDRHFTVCQHLGLEMLTVPMCEDGPDMDAVERLAAWDEAVKGIWCVPKYSNPSGITYADEVVRRLAAMRTRAEDFRIFWDNAYAVHDLYERTDPLLNILDACKEAGHPDRVFIFGSTAKISFAGAGIAMAAGSETNMAWLKRHLFAQTIGPDKLNQLRHVRCFGDLAGIRRHMEKHRAILRPKFEMVRERLAAGLGDKGIADWTRPNGGYFISFNTLPGCAGRVVALAAAAGVKLTEAGATFPYGLDPLDRNIRIAPSYPPLDELQQALELLIICVQLASAERLLAG